MVLDYLPSRVAVELLPSQNTPETILEALFQSLHHLSRVNIILVHRVGNLLNSGLERLRRDLLLLLLALLHLDDSDSLVVNQYPALEGCLAFVVEHHEPVLLKVVAHVLARLFDFVESGHI